MGLRGELRMTATLPLLGMGGVLAESAANPWGGNRRLIHGVERGARGSAPRCRCEEAAMVLAESGASWTSGVECG